MMKIPSDTYNIKSPNHINHPCDLNNLSGWLEQEIDQIQEIKIHSIIKDICLNIEEFVCWPQKSLLLWKGCDRNSKYHKFPEQIKFEAKFRKIALDTRTNGPAIAAYLFGGGKRPKRYGSTNSWSIHHVYSRKFPYVGKEETLWAVKSGLHFTQSAGLVAIHPIADQMADEYPFFSWWLRAKAFHKFQYDPDVVFSSTSLNSLGFPKEQNIEIFYS